MLRPEIKGHNIPRDNAPPAQRNVFKLRTSRNIAPFGGVGDSAPPPQEREKEKEEVKAYIYVYAVVVGRDYFAIVFRM